MAVPVYFADMRSRNSRSSTVTKIERLLKAVELGRAVTDGDLTAIKIHFGETGNDAFVSPVFARIVADGVRKAGGKPFFADTNTLYSGSRHNAVDHLETAILHGFDRAVCGAPVLIADGLSGTDYSEIEVGLKHFDKVKIANGFAHADAMVVVSHFKGHEQAGFGGAIKNLAMGCAPPEGKKEQHSIRFEVRTSGCIGCGTCVEVCPEKAIAMQDKKAKIRRELCIGCAECANRCPTKTIGLDWETDLSDFIERMVEYAKGAVVSKPGKVVYLTFVTRVVPDCDCAPWSDLSVVPDQGILASTDPVAIDQAAFDLVKTAAPTPGGALDGKVSPGDDKFGALHPDTNGCAQLIYGEKIGLGSSSYELVRI
ncbi:MAG: DUF362 domain-containing protein [Rectinemataceae bacterium]